MSINTKFVAGFGIDLKDQCYNIFNQYLQRKFPDLNVESNHIQDILKIWWMDKNGYKMPDNHYQSEEKSLTKNWKVYHQIANSELNYLNLSLEIYGHCYKDNGLYLVVVKNSVVVKEQLDKEDLNKAFNEDEIKHLKYFIQDFNLNKPDWHIVTLTC